MRSIKVPPKSSFAAQAVTPKKKPPPPEPKYPLYSWDKISVGARMVFVRDTEEANLELSKLIDGPIGIDMEWKPTYVKGSATNPVALVQIANADTVLLLHIHAMSAIPAKLHELFENGSIAKAGVGIQGDCTKLYQDWNVNVHNCVDLSLLARTADNARWKGRYKDPIGLSRLVETYEELSLSKGKVRRSNWEKALTGEQLHYAANDAHSSFIIYQRLCGMLEQMDKMPIPSYYTFHCIEGRLVTPHGEPWAPENPDYDPGPPPPPKTPKCLEGVSSPQHPDANQADSQAKAALPDGSQNHPEAEPSGMQMGESKGRRYRKKRPSRKREQSLPRISQLVEGF